MEERELLMALKELMELRTETAVSGEDGGLTLVLQEDDGDVE